MKRLPCVVGRRADVASTAVSVVEISALFPTVVGFVVRFDKRTDGARVAATRVGVFDNVVRVLPYALVLVVVLNVFTVGAAVTGRTKAPLVIKITIKSNRVEFNLGSTCLYIIS